MKIGSSKKMKNTIVTHGVDGSRAAELFKDAWRALRSLLKASPNLIKMDVEKLKGIQVMDHLVRRKKLNNKDDGIDILMQHSTSTLLTLDHLSHPLHEAAPGHAHSLSLTTKRIRDGGAASRSYSLSNTASAEDVDELADAFIVSFYNNMRLEKQRSYRVYQEMLARGT